MKLTGLSKDIFQLRYAEDGETWEDRVKKVANHIASNELPEKKNEIEQEVYDAIVNLNFLPGGRILYGCGRKDSMLLNCFVLDVEDNRFSISQLLANYYLIAVSGGGVGINYSKIRPKGSPIRGRPGSALGVISEIKKIDAIGNYVKSGGSRRVALLACLDVGHPDIMEFISCKKEDEAISNHNISVIVNRDFIEAIKKYEYWKFYFSGMEYFAYVFEDEKKKEHLVFAQNDKNIQIIADNFCKDNEFTKLTFKGKKLFKARDIWNAIIKGACYNGEPGLLFEENIKDNFSSLYFENFIGTNPCGEVPLPNFGTCCLGSINLHSIFNRKKNEIEWHKLKLLIKLAVRFLDNVIDINTHPISETQVVAKKSRRIGLGVMGLHYVLIEKGLRYGSEDSIQYIERLFKTIRDEAYIASVELAQEKGVFPQYDFELFSKNSFFKRLPPRIKRMIKEHGIRNASILSIAPNGTISMIAGVSSGIEPIFAPIYKTKYIENDVYKSRNVVDPLFAEYVINDWDLSNFVGSHDITPEEHLAVEAAIQDYVDSSISKTINIPKDFDYKELGNLILDYSEHLKGITVYREGSRKNEPLERIKFDTLKRDELKKIANEYLKSNQILNNCKSGKCDI